MPPLSTAKPQQFTLDALQDLSSKQFLSAAAKVSGLVEPLTSIQPNLGFSHSMTAWP
jgi:hypothetical protein